MIDIKKEECCGCSACSQVCPKKCINMIPDKEGFYYPVIKKDLCVDCQLCEKVCPSISDLKYASKKKAIIAYSTIEEERAHSSSGGIFSLLAEKVLKEDGLIYGASYDTDWMVVHTKCDKFEELSNLRGSKYLQSRNEGVFAEIKQYLNEGKQILYTGTSCQVTGLKTFLKKDYENLYTVDVLCHGVPSPGVWERYIKLLQKRFDSKITHISFRDKCSGWKNYSFTVEFESGDVFSEKFYNNSFMRLFLGNTILRPSCHVCKYKSMDRSSDLTIGDAWGLEKIFPDLDDNKGMSVLVIHNNKGLNLVESISSNIVKRDVDLEVILPENVDSRKPVKAGKGRRLAFLYYYRKKTVDEMCISVESSLKAKLLRAIIH